MPIYQYAILIYQYLFRSNEPANSVKDLLKLMIQGISKLVDRITMLIHINIITKWPDDNIALEIKHYDQSITVYS